MTRTHIPPGGGNNDVREHNLYDLRHFIPTTGNIWFVDSGAASGGNGKSPAGAVTTLDAAVNLATADNGDIIYVLENHAETITGASGVDVDIAGLTIIGLGRGRNRPTFTFTTANAASFDVAAADNWIENLAFVNGKDGQTAMVNVSAADVTIKGCEFQHGDACTQAALAILTTAAANRLRVEDCHFHGTSDAGTAAAIRIVGGDSLVIKGNYMIGAYAATGGVNNITTAATNILIDGNVILNQTADGNNKAIVLDASTTGVLLNNRMAVIDSTCPAPVTAAGAYVSGNYHTGAAGVTASTLM